METDEIKNTEDALTSYLQRNIYIPKDERITITNTPTIETTHLYINGDDLLAQFGDEPLPYPDKNCHPICRLDIPDPEDPNKIKRIPVYLD